MCGILGFASVRGGVDRDWLQNGLHAMKHRGPDDSGIWCSNDGLVGLGHVRLSIVDLSSLGHQPMLDKESGLAIVFNGEIYNFKKLRRELELKGYTFRSGTDTEVILVAYREWGRDCIHRFVGMFAFAIYDSRLKQLFLARDRVGEKPLYYSLEDGVFRFSSELKGLFADRSFVRRVDLGSLDCYLGTGYAPPQSCLVKAVKKLPPAHQLVFDLETGRGVPQRYWQVPEEKQFPNSETYDERMLVDELEGLLGDAITNQVIADVPVGVLLSGGLDSSLVTTLASRATSRITAFTVRFPSFLKFDETSYARLIAKHAGVCHVELNAGDVDPSIMFQLARIFDEPVVDSSMIPTYLICTEVRKECTVVLGGDGGDELFGGYPHYQRILWLKKYMSWFPSQGKSWIAKRGGQILPVGFKGRNWLQGLDTNLDFSVPQVTCCLDVSSRALLFADVEQWGPVSEEIWRQRVPKESDLLRRAMRMDFENYLPEDLLVKIDRASMANSLEMRSPLLDHRLVEFAFGSVPSHRKIDKRGRKLLLKELGHRILPKQFDYARKQGFSIPLNAWLTNGKWKSFFREVLFDADQHYFNRNAVAKLFEGQDRGRGNAERLFALVLFELWRREYKIAL
jgi:asparagine synthase (glutamine-hydrolysing)